MSIGGWFVWALGVILLWLTVDNFAVNFIPDINFTGKFIIYMLLDILWIAIANIAFRD